MLVSQIIFILLLPTSSLCLVSREDTDIFYPEVKADDEQFENLDIPVKYIFVFRVSMVSLI